MLGSAFRTTCSTVCAEGRTGPWRFPQFLSLPGWVPPVATATAGASGPTGLGAAELRGRAWLRLLGARQLGLHPPRSHPAPRRNPHLPFVFSCSATPVLRASISPSAQRGVEDLGRLGALAA